jgi:hypothetical protein
VAAAFRVPPHFIGLGDSASGGRAWLRRLRWKRR